MSIVVLGGHERMERDYINIGKKYGCKIKIFTKMQGDLSKRIGNPDYVVMFTDVVSHKIVNTANKVLKKKNIPSLKLHKSSVQTLEDALIEIR